MRKAVLWPYRYADMRDTWAPQTVWIAEALERCGLTVKRHPLLQCKGLNSVGVYDPATDNPCTVAVYNHADQSDLTGNVVKAACNWFMKPTVPDTVHTTLDAMGYGPYSSVAYRRPPLEHMHAGLVTQFYLEQVPAWVSTKTTKYRNKLALTNSDIEATDYWLVLGQCEGDSVVTRHDFGGYLCKLYQVVAELARLDTRQIIVKLHPWMNGENATGTAHSDAVADSLREISTQVVVYSGARSVHDFLPRCRAVLLANSGAGYEAMMHRKPIIAWGFPEYHWVTYDLRHLADLRRALAVDRWHRPRLQAAFLFWYLTQYCLFNRESAYRRVSDLLREANL